MKNKSILIKSSKIVMLLFFITVIRFNLFATVYNVHVGISHVNCYLGDTLAFYSSFGDCASINGVQQFCAPQFYSGYFGQYIIIGGEYSFCVSNAEGPWCGTISVLPTVIIKNDIKKEGITVSPNPTTDFVKISNIETAQINVYNQSGQLLKQLKFNNADILISLLEFSQGIYFIEILSNNKLLLYEILKQ